MKARFFVVALAFTLCLSTLLTAASSYKEELKAFEQMASHKMVFNEDAHDGLKAIARDIEAYPTLSRFQRYILGFFETVLVTPETMSTLHGYIDGVCKQNNLPTPTVFIATNHGLFNAFALKLFWGNGVIIISKKMIEEAANDELNGVLAHEIGHIKFNHSTKNFIIYLGSYVATTYATNASTDNQNLRIIVPLLSAPLLTSLIINKRFEKEADEFAYDTMGKGKGLKKFFERLEQREQQTERDFDATRAMLQDHSHNLAFFDYAELLFRYYMVKGEHKIGNAFNWMYHNTFLGDHPSHHDRIQAIENHLAKQA